MDETFVLVVFFVVVLFGWLALAPTNAWLMLAGKYGSSYLPGPSVKCWISLRYPPYSQPFVLRFGEFFDGRLTVASSGLQINLWFFTNFWRPILLVPWQDLGVIGHRGHYEFEGDRVFVTFAKVPNIRMRISGRAMDALMRASAPFQITAEGLVAMLPAEAVPAEAG